MKVTIIRAQNGWILEEEREDEFDEGYGVTQQVFEDEEHPNQTYSEASSLANLLWSAFQLHYQSKWEGGITLDVHEKGREEEFMEEYEEEKYEAEEYKISLPDVDPADAFRDFYPIVGDDQMPETD